MRQKLKSLELHGYKTFATKTRFEFPDQITAIVGPNGSGKSNIADAIRWVLGEQAYSLLRGKKTVDMIFTGSELKPRASMASASIVFDNEDGWLPIDYTEVSLTRRAYRNGENEYLLNNTKIRLKEINELLANSGLSERTYTIIGQGLVDSALSLKPEERRRFFEEAAGIELYRSRRDEAIQKLDNTRRNMERVQDILNELKPRLKSLEKQAERARDYERTKADLLVLLRDWYGYQWTNLQQEMAASLDIQRKQEEKLSFDRTELEAIDKEIENSRDAMRNMRNDLAIWHQSSSEQHTIKEKINRELAILDERNISYQMKKLDLEQSQNILQEELISLKKQLEGLCLERQSKTEKLVKVSNDYQLSESKILERQKQREIIEKQIQDVRDLLENKETRNVQIRTKLEEIDHRISLINSDLQNIKNSNYHELEKLKTITAEQTAQNKLVDEKAIEINSIHESINDITIILKNLDDELHRLLDEQSQLNLSLTTLKTQKDILDQAEKTLSGFSSGSKSLMEAVNSGKVKGKIDLFLSHLQIKPAYEIAIASVLGETIEALVLEKNVNLEDILNFLDKGDSGRTVLLPLAEYSKSDFSISERSENGQKAYEVIETDKKIQPIIQKLFMNVYLVKDRNEARQLLRKRKGEYRVVTLKGEVFNSNGTVIAGREIRVKSLSRKREMKDLDKTLISKQEELIKLDTKLLKLRNQIENKKEELSKIIELQEKCAQVQSLNNKTYNEISLNIEQIKNKIKWQEDQIGSLNDQITKSITSKAEFMHESEEVFAQIQLNQKKLEEFFEQLKSLPLDDLQQEFYASHTSKAVEEQVVLNLNNQIQRQQNRETEINNLLIELQEKIAATERDILRNQEEKEQQIEKENEMEKTLISLDQKIKPSEIQIQELETKVSNIIQKQEKSRQQFLITERHSIQAQMRVSRIREQQENLKRRIEEDFGLVSYDYALSVEGPNPLPLDGIVENLPRLTEIPDMLEENIKQQKSFLRRIGPINPEAQKEYKDVQERFEFLIEQTHDLDKADSDLRQVVAELDELMKTEFTKTFKAVNEIFKNIFEKLFGGGSANLIIADEENLTESGIDIQATLPGKRKQELASLSGGERSLTAVALIFALLKVSPTPFCILDEVDAMLDESNVMRFGDLLRDLSEATQFIVITHNRNTVQLANVLYGVTMGKDSASQVISLKLDELTEELVQ